MRLLCAKSGGTRFASKMVEESMNACYAMLHQNITNLQRESFAGAVGCHREQHATGACQEPVLSAIPDPSPRSF